MTPEVFKIRMQEIKTRFSGDLEVQHIKADSLLKEALADMGYQEGITIYNSMDKHYT